MRQRFRSKCCCQTGVPLPCACPGTPAPPKYGLVRISGLGGTWTVYTPWVFMFGEYRRNKYVVQLFDSSSCSCPGCTFVEGGTPVYSGSLPMLVKVWNEVSADGVTVDTSVFEAWNCVYAGWSLGCDELSVYTADGEGWPEGVRSGLAFFRAAVTPTTTGSVSNELAEDWGSDEVPLHSSLTIDRDVETCRLCARYPVSLEDESGVRVAESISDRCMTAQSQWESSVYVHGTYSFDDFGGPGFVAYGSVEAEAPTAADLCSVTRHDSGYVHIGSFGSSCCGAAGDYAWPKYYYLDEHDITTPVLVAGESGTPPEGFPETITVTAGKCAYRCDGGHRNLFDCASSFVVTISGCTGSAAVLNGSWIVTRQSEFGYYKSGDPTSPTITRGAFVPDEPSRFTVTSSYSGQYIEFESGTPDCDNEPSDYTWSFVDGTAGTSGATVTVA